MRGKQKFSSKKFETPIMNFVFRFSSIQDIFKDFFYLKLNKKLSDKGILVFVIEIVKMETLK